MFPVAPLHGQPYPNEEDDQKTSSFFHSNFPMNLDLFKTQTYLFYFQSGTGTVLLNANHVYLAFGVGLGKKASKVYLKQVEYEADAYEGNGGLQL